MNEEDIEKISKYVASLDDKQLANLQQLLADTIQRVEKNKGRPLTEKEVKAISVHEIAHKAFKAERSLATWFHNVTENRIRKEMEED